MASFTSLHGYIDKSGDLRAGRAGFLLSFFTFKGFIDGIVRENAIIIFFKQAFHVVAIGLTVVSQNQWSDLHAETQPKRLSNLARNLRLANTRYIEDHYNLTEQSCT